MPLQNFMAERPADFQLQFSVKLDTRNAKMFPTFFAIRYRVTGRRVTDRREAEASFSPAGCLT